MKKNVEWNPINCDILMQSVYHHIDEIYKFAQKNTFVSKESNMLTKISDEFTARSNDVAFVQKSIFDKNECILWKLKGVIFEQTKQKNNDSYIFKFKKTVTDGNLSEIFISSEFNIDDVKLMEKFTNCLKNTKNEIELIKKISDDIGIQEYQVVYYLIKNKLISYNGSFKLTASYTFDVNRNYVEQIENKLMVDQKHKDIINNERKFLGEIFNGFSKNAPSFTAVNDGTGFGKSYALFNEYINTAPGKKFSEYSENESKRNLIFLTPQKAQIDIDINQVNIANEKGIKILPVLGISDFQNPEFINWISKLTNEETLNEILKDPIFSKQSELRKNIKSIMINIKQLGVKIDKNDFEDKSKEEIEYELKNSKNNFNEKLKLLCKNIIKGKKIKDIFEKNDAITNLIDYISPLTRSAYYPTIYVATSSKFEAGINFLAEMKKVSATKNNEFDFTIQIINFYDYIGMKKNKKDEDTNVINPLIATDITFEDFVIDDKNQLYKENVSFDIFIDEEHKSYDDSFDKKIIPLVDNDSQIEHVLSVVYRLYQLYESDVDDGIEPEVIKEIKLFFNDIKNTLSKKSKFSKIIDLEVFLSIFKDNLFGIRIDSKDSEQIMNITKNVFSFSKQNFYNNEELKNIKLYTDKNKSTILLKLEKDNESSSVPSLYDFYQFILSLLYVLITLKSNSVLVNFLKETHNNAKKDQNSPIMELINTKKFNKNDLDYLFTDPNKVMTLNHYFAYFLPKTVFSIELKEKNKNYNSSKSDYLSVDFTINLIKPLPETDLLKLLVKTKNNVVVLSATTGFTDLYTSHYNREFLTNYSKSLKFTVYKRNVEDLDHLVNIKDERKNFRNVIIKNIDKNKIEPLTDCFSLFFKDVLNFYEHDPKYINHKINKYKVTEFQRTLNAICLAAQKKENSLILSLSHDPLKIVKDYIKSFNKNNIKIIKDTDDKIFTIKFENDNEIIKLKVILFDADLASKQIVKEHMLIKEPNEVIAFVSSYKSAGTGLNYFVSYDTNNYDNGLKVDFDTLYMVASPFYSNTNVNAAEINNISNFITLLKYQASSNQAIITINDFNKSLFNNDHKRILNIEHQYSIYKTVNQAVGRIERKDNKMTSHIYIDEELKLDIGLRCSQIKDDIFVVKSLSYLNDILFNNSIDECFKYKLDSQQIHKLKNINLRKNKHYINKFECFLKDEIQNTRNNGSYPHLNELLRSDLAYTDPNKYIEYLKEALKDIAKNNTKYEKVLEYIDCLYIDKADIAPNNILFKVFLDSVEEDNGEKQFIMNDISNIRYGDNKYEPFKTIIPDNRYIDESKTKNSDEITKIFKGFPDKKNTDNFNQYIPIHPFIPLLKGIVGENIFKKTLDVIGVQNMLDINQVLNKFHELYELYDFFIEHDDHLICIDVKNWSLQNQDQNKIDDFNSKVSKKYETLIKSSKKAGYNKVTILYLNINIGDNINHKIPEKDNNIYFLNLFKKKENYVERLLKSYTSVKEIKHNCINRELKVNEILKQILGVDL